MSSSVPSNVPLYPTRGRRPPLYGSPPSGAPTEPARRVGCGGCLLYVVGVLVWAALAFAPLPVADDLLGPALGAHWVLFPDDVQQVHVPAGSHLSLYVGEVESDLRLDDFQPTVRCSVREGGGGWRALPVVQVPLVGPTLENGRRTTSEGREVRIHAVVTASGNVAVRCAGSEVIDLRREDRGVQGRLTVVLRLVRFLWPALITLVLWGPVVLIGRRRRAGRSSITGPAAETP